MKVKFVLLIAIGSVAQHIHETSGEGWRSWQDRSTVSVIEFTNVGYRPSTRTIYLASTGGNRSCPDMKPKKLAPDDPVGSRALGGLHFQRDPVHRLLHQCKLENVSSAVNATGIHLFIWQPPSSFYTQGSASLMIWIHDYLATLVHATIFAKSFDPSKRALLVLLITRRARFFV